MASTLPILARVGLRNVFRNTRRSGLTIAALSVGIWSCVALSSLARGASRQMGENAIKNFLGHVQIHAQNYLDDPTVENTIKEPPEPLLQSAFGGSGAQFTVGDIGSIVARVRVPAVVMSERESAGITLIGTEPEAEARQSFVASSIAEGRYLESISDPGIILGRALVDLLRTGLGKRVVVMTQHSNGSLADQGFRIVGVFDAELDSTEKTFALTGIATAQRMLGLNGGISEISLYLKNESRLDKVVSLLRSRFPKMHIASWIELEPLIRSLVSVQSGMLILWFGIVVITVSFGLANTVLMSLIERARELGILKALGMHPRLVVALVICEVLWMILFGILLGNALAALTLFALSEGIDLTRFATATEYFGMSRVIRPSTEWFDLLTANSLVVVVGLAAGFYPAWQASKQLPAPAISTR